MSIYSIPEAQERLSELVDLAIAGDEVIVSLPDESLVVLKPISKKQMDELKETIEITSDKSLMCRIRTSKKRMRAGDYVTLEEVMSRISWHLGQ